MTIGFSNGAYNKATGTRNAFGALSDRLVAEGYPRMVSRSGDREPEDQLRIWYERMTLTPGSRKVYGTKRWQGKTWYRIHPDTVAAPDTSNHEKRRSNDLTAPYNNRNTAAHKRAQALAPRHNITWEGKGFSEDWHWTYWGSLGKIADAINTGGKTAETEQENPVDCMIYINGKIYALAPGYIKHCDSTAQVSEAKARGVKQHSYTGADRLDQWVRALDFYGIPRDVLDKNGWVLNPETGKHVNGALWTWERVVVSKTDTLISKFDKLSSK